MHESGITLQYLTYRAAEWLAKNAKCNVEFTKSARFEAHQ
jgi:hypothetical protein